MSGAVAARAGLLVIVLGFGTNDTPAPSDPRCGSRCLYVALKGLGFSVKDLEELEGRLGPPPRDGYTLAQLDSAARSYGAHTLGVETTFDNLQLRGKPFACIAHLTHDHFVLISDISETSATVIDPPRKSSVPLDTLGALWDRKALLVAPEPLVREEDLPRPIAWQPWAIGAALVVLACATVIVFRRNSATPLRARTP